MLSFAFAPLFKWDYFEGQMEFSLYKVQLLANIDYRVFKKPRLTAQIPYTIES